jgi:hypothetical protein
VCALKLPIRPHTGLFDMINGTELALASLVAPAVKDCISLVFPLARTVPQWPYHLLVYVLPVTRTSYRLCHC